jgi:hypothetical protein
MQKFKDEFNLSHYVWSTIKKHSFDGVVSHGRVFLNLPFKDKINFQSWNKQDIRVSGLNKTHYLQTNEKCYEDCTVKFRIHRLRHPFW